MSCGPIVTRSVLAMLISAALVACGNSSDDSGPGNDTPSPASDYPVPPGAVGVPKPSGPVGGVQVLNWAGFGSAVSYTFDDSNSSQIEHYAELQALGVRLTFYLWTGRAESMDPIWAQALEDGHELGNHTKSHLMNGTGEDIDAGTTFIEETFGVTPYTMAAPYGAPVYSELAESRFFINRGVSNGVILPNDSSDPLSLYCYIPPEGAAADVINEQIDDAREQGGWRVLLVHGFTGGTDQAYQPVDIGEFVSSVEHTKAFGDVWIDSVVNVGAYWLGQKAFTNATMTTSGNTITYTWDLPEHFPPGKFVRATASGGTLEQDGRALTWNNYGYYEIALDSKSLTVRP